MTEALISNTEAPDVQALRHFPDFFNDHQVSFGILIRKKHGFRPKMLLVIECVHIVSCHSISIGWPIIGTSCPILNYKETCSRTGKKMRYRISEDRAIFKMRMMRGECLANTTLAFEIGNLPQMFIIVTGGHGSWSQ